MTRQHEQLVWGYDPKSGDFGIVAPDGRVVSRRIEMPALSRSEAVLDYVAQQVHHGYSDECIGALVRTLDGLLGLQANYCSYSMGGATGKVVEDVEGLVAQRVSRSTE